VLAKLGRAHAGYLCCAAPIALQKILALPGIRRQPTAALKH
jgi:hypothetical protein